MNPTDTADGSPADRPRVRVERDGAVLLLGLDRPEKRNAADLAMLSGLAAGYGAADRDPDIRCVLVHAIGEHFTAGLDLADIGPRVGEDGLSFLPEGGIDPWHVSGPALRKPVVVAVQGTCLTLGIELALASEIVVAEESARFGQIEVSRGILPFGGATIRLARAAGWGRAMRWMLTGDLFDVHEAERLGVVQEIVPDGGAFDRALELAQRIAAQAPLAVMATLENARAAVSAAEADGAAGLQSDLVRLSAGEDAAIGMRAFLARETAQFVGR